MLIQRDSDDFNRADSTTLGSSAGGNTWVEFAGNAQIVSNAVRSVAADSSLNRVRLGLNLGADHYAEADITIATAAADGTQGAVYCRKTGDAVLTFYQLWWEYDAGAGQTQIRLARLESGAFTEIGTPLARGTRGQTHRLRLYVVGSRLRGYYDNVLEFDETDTNIAGNEQTGFDIRAMTGGAIADAIADDFVCGSDGVIHRRHNTLIRL